MSMAWSTMSRTGVSIGDPWSRHSADISLMGEHPGIPLDADGEHLLRNASNRYLSERGGRSTGILNDQPSECDSFPGGSRPAVQGQLLT